jgi:pilus assembly protein CpaE
MAGPLSVILVGRDARLRGDTRGHLTATGKVQVVAESSDFSRSLELIEQLNPHAVVVLLDGEEEAGFEFIRRVGAEHRDIAVVCSGLNCGNDVIIRAFRSGAREFLVQPLTPNEVKEVVERLEELTATGEGERKSLGAIIAVYSSKGGSGTTTVCVNLAAELARQTARQTVIVDLNLQHGNIPIFFGVQPTYSVTDVARNEARLDIQLLRTFLTKIRDNLYCLAAPLKPEEADDVFPHHLEAALGLLRTQFSYILVDTQHVLDPNTVTALDTADIICVVTQLDLASVFNTKRVLETFARMGYGGEKVKLLVNRYNKTSDLPLDKIADVLGHPVDLTLAEDIRSARDSLNLGKPLVLSQLKSPLVRQFSELAEAILGPQGEERPKQSKGLFTMFGKGRAKA